MTRPENGLTVMSDDHDTEDPTDLSQARAMFSHEPEPPPEPDDELDDNIFTYQPETLASLPPGTVLIVEGGALTRRDIERLSELGSERLRGSPLVLPSGVNVSLVDVEQATREPDPRTLAEFVSKVSKGQALISLEAGPGPRMIVKPKHVEHDRDIYRNRDEYQIKGVVVSADAHRLPTMQPEHFGLHVTKSQFDSFVDHGGVEATIVVVAHDDETFSREKLDEVRERLGGVDWGTGAVGVTSMTIDTTPFQAAAENVFAAHGSAEMEHATRALERQLKHDLDGMVRAGEISGYSEPVFRHDDVTGVLTVDVTAAQPPKVDGVVVELSVGSPEAEKVKRDVERYFKDNPSLTGSGRASFKVNSLAKPRKYWLDPTDFSGARPSRPFARQELQQSPPPDHAYCKTTVEPESPKPFPKPREYWLRHSDGEIVVVVKVVKAKFPADATVVVERKTSAGVPSAFTGHFNLSDFWEAFVRVPSEKRAKGEVMVDDVWLDSHGNKVLVTGVKSDAVYYRFESGPTEGLTGFASMSNFKAECERDDPA